VYDCLSLIVVGLSVTNVIRCVDNEISCVDVVTLARSLEQLGVVHNAVFVEVNLLVLNNSPFTFVLTPQNLNS
jgi:hypothetical protein